MFGAFVAYIQLCVSKCLQKLVLILWNNQESSLEKREEKCDKRGER